MGLLGVLGDIATVGGFAVGAGLSATGVGLPVGVGVAAGGSGIGALLHKVENDAEQRNADQEAAQKKMEADLKLEEAKHAEKKRAAAVAEELWQREQHESKPQQLMDACRNNEGIGRIECIITHMSKSQLEGVGFNPVALCPPNLRRQVTELLQTERRRNGIP